MKKNTLVNLLMFLTFFFLCFVTTPRYLRANFISSGFSNRLAWYPMFGLFLIYLCERYKYIRNNNINKIKFIKTEKTFFKFLSVYSIFMLISLIHGLYIYPYYEQILNGPINQIEKLPMVLKFLKSHSFNPNPKILTQVWMGARLFKGLILNILYTFGFAYILYYFINKKGWNNSINLFKKGVFLSLIIIFIYSIIELFYLMGNQTATNLLGEITPFFHDIKNNGTWWPPLFWNNQVRSIFAEPSYFGVYAAMVTPILWDKIFDEKKEFLAIVFSAFFTFLIFATQSRTAIGLLLGEVFLLILFTLYFDVKNKFKNLSFILLITSITFFLAVLFSTNFHNKSIVVSSNFEKETINYIENNIKSIVGKNKRSNNARYAISLANFKVGMDHPVFGVGFGLKGAYMTEKFSKDVVKYNKEVKQWIKNMNKKGILRAAIPNIEEYMGRFAHTGVIGLGLFLYPWIFILIKLPKKIKQLSYKKKNEAISLYIAIIAILVSGISTNLKVSYIPWVLLAFAYALIREKNEGQKD